MTSEVLLLVLRLNLVASASIALVLALRPFVRRWFGGHAAYRLWMTVPIALGGAIVPPNETSGAIGPVEHVADRAGAWLDAAGRDWMLFAVWGAGVVICLGLVAWRYAGFMVQARRGRAGPAIVGILSPRLVLPSDFKARFTPDERRLVRAHERAHIDRLDARWNALVLAAQCLNWFNPLIHLAARAMRFDQELSCDATVMTRLPTERRRYAEALLRSQCAGAESPLVCSWSGPAARLLMTRLTALMGRRPSVGRGELGDLLFAGLWVLVFVAAFAAQPPDRLTGTRILVMDMAPQTAPAPELPAVSAHPSPPPAR